MAEAIREEFDELNAASHDLNVKLPRDTKLKRCALREKLVHVMDELQWELDSFQKDDYSSVAKDASDLPAVQHSTNGDAGKADILVEAGTGPGPNQDNTDTVSESGPIFQSVAAVSCCLM